MLRALVWSPLWEAETRVGGWILRSMRRPTERPQMKGFIAAKQGINDAFVTRCPELREPKIFVGHCCSYHIWSLELWALSESTSGREARGWV